MGLPSGLHCLGRRTLSSVTAASFVVAPTPVIWKIRKSPLPLTCPSKLAAVDVVALGEDGGVAVTKHGEEPGVGRGQLAACIRNSKAGIVKWMECHHI